MIIVAELAFNDGGHVPFNAGLLAVVRMAFPLEKVCFFGTQEHIGEVKKQSGEVLGGSIEWKEMANLSSNLTYFARLLHEKKILQTILRHFPQEATGPFLLTSVRPATLVALKWVKRFGFKDIRTQIVLHGHLSGVVGKRYRNPVRRFQEMRTALTILGNENLQYLVLEESLRDVLLKCLPDLSGNVEVLDHPLPPNEKQTKTSQLSIPIRFGFLGLANEAKGFPVFVKLAEDVTAKYSNQAEFHAIGRFSSEANPTQSTVALTTKPGVERLSREEYVQGVEQLHYIVLPHQASFYELNSSGTLLDALAWGKPLIARKIAMFEKFFAKHGDIGHLFTTDRELREIVEHVVEKADTTRYEAQALNIQRAQCSRSSETLATEYQKMCEKLANPTK